MVQPERVTVTVNDRQIEVQAGLNILQALGHEGVEIPSLCNDVRLKRANGSCGMCVVE
ncbi:MAG: (2Fe-2S)-binding protein, partial [Demequina sp.]|nr:(2Fe-2S)-binding protein [Demequina sp.]